VTFAIVTVGAFGDAFTGGVGLGKIKRFAVLVDAH